MDYLMLKPVLVRLEEQFDMRRLGSLCMDSKGYSKVVRYSFVHGIQIGARFIDIWGYAIFDFFFFFKESYHANQFWKAHIPA